MITLVQIVIDSRTSGVAPTEVDANRVYRARVSGKDLYEMKIDLPVTDVSISWKRRYWPAKRIPISNALRKGILAYLNDYNVQRDLFFDCYAFANVANGVPSHPPKLVRKFWKIHLDAFTPENGHTIFLMQASGKDRYVFRHAAICIDTNLFVSVYGAWGNLRFASLHDMMKEYEADALVKATPR